MLATSLLALSTVPALADGCVYDPSSSSTTCTGNPALPILVTENLGLTITALSGDLVPATGSAAATLSNLAAEGSPAMAATLTFNDGAHGLQVDEATGLLVSTAGGTGPSAVQGPFNASGGPGGNGAATSVLVTAGTVSIASGTAETAAILLSALGGQGGGANMQPQSPNGNNVTGGAAGAGGGFAGPASVFNVAIADLSVAGGAAGLLAGVTGGAGGALDPNSWTEGVDGATGSAGGAGGAGGDLTSALVLGSVTVNQAATAVVQLQSSGGNGSSGGLAIGGGSDEDSPPAIGGAGGAGGDGGAVSVTGTVTVSGSALSGFAAVTVQSFGGSGGAGGAASGGSGSRGGAGGAGGAGGSVTLGAGSSAPFGLTAALSGDGVIGLIGRSYGGPGGDGGASQNSFGDPGQGGAAAGGGDSGAVTATITGSVTTSGTSADAVVLQSVGGFAGSGPADSFGASGQSRGDAGAVSMMLTVVANASGLGIATTGSGSDAVTGQSVGGGGGKAFQNLGLTGLGGADLAGGDGAAVVVTVSGAEISTGGSFSRGIFAQSGGGGGGSGGPNATIATLGAAGGTGGSAAAVTVSTGSAIFTTGDYSDAIVATSHGGGGGSAVSAVNLFSVGGQPGGGGGDGGEVGVTFSGSLFTSGSDADAIFAQSVGGGGGDGANAVATGVLYTNAIGGGGGTGGASGTVSVTQQAGVVMGAITTGGDRARGVVAQSIGGGGGSGGTAVAAGFLGGYSHAVGGSGGTGGAGETVAVVLGGAVATAGTHSDGVFAQSIGGGGGIAAGVVNADLSGPLRIANDVGGSGGSGGDAAAVSVTTGDAITTAGAHSAAIVALATGGGGGHSGIMVSNSTIAIASIDVSIGGTGGAGGSVTGPVTVTANGSLTTSGDHSDGILAHSVGGGGGHGSTMVSTTAGDTASVVVSLGGAGGAAGNAGDVAVSASGGIATGGTMSNAISAVSTGGGGGSGGSIFNANVASVGDLGVVIGASGGGGGSAGTVTVNATGAISTVGAQSDGIYASSVGGKGGVAGTHLANNATANVLSAGSVTVALGGRGGDGGTAGAVAVNTSSGITTQGDLSTAIFAQSVAGDGGRARGTIAANIGDVGNATVLIGGAGGNGGMAGTVSVVTDNPTEFIATYGALSHGIFAQSLGGSGGGGGFASEASVNIATEDTGGVSGQVGITVGGGGAPGGRSGGVTVQNGTNIVTSNLMSFGIAAQSIGGNGGDGGSVYAFNVDANSPDAVNVNLDVGSDGGLGAEAAAVQVTNTGSILTRADLSLGAMVQSVGGNGGNGGSSYTALLQVVASSRLELDMDIGGAGGGGGASAGASLVNHGSVVTAGGGSDALYVQSVGGGGGRGGNAGYVAVNLSSPIAEDNTEVSTTMNVKLGGGGDGGSGADSGAVSVTNTAVITTTGTRARGIFAQSVGGGGGDGGTTSATSFGISDICNNPGLNTYVCESKLDPEKKQVSNFSINMTLELGGSGSTGGNGNTVTVDNSGSISTAGQLSHGIYAQSIGGGGGNGGEGALGVEAFTTNSLANTILDLPGNFLPSFSSLDIAIGGTGAGGGDGGAVTVTHSGAITISGTDGAYVSKYTGFSGGTRGALSFVAGGTGIFAQSVGGGGGDGGAGSSSFTAIVTVGNSGGGGGQGGAVTVNSTGTITNTSGFSGTGIFAQSVGGGGGTAGDVGQAFSDAHENLNIGAGIAVSNSPGAGGDGGTVQVTSGGAILTTGTASSGIIAQSVGGSGGIAAVASDARTTIYVGSGVAAGNGGDVTVTNTAPITVQGPGSVGVVGLSAGGANSGDQSGTVTVNANADITAGGSGGRAILVSSDSYQNQATGDVYINVNQGVTVQTGADGAETILVLNGSSNSTVTNAGTILSGNAAHEAIYAKSKNSFLIDNYGTITGSITGESLSEGGSAGTFDLQNYGLLNSGATITLPGDTAILYSEGTISPGAKGVIARTEVSVGLGVNLAATNTYLADFDPSLSVATGIVASDMLSLTVGTAGEGGQVASSGSAIAPSVLLSQPGNALRSGSAYILDSNVPVAASDFIVSNTATVNYQLSTSTAVTSGYTTLVLGYDISTTPWDRPGAPQAILSRVNDNHRSFGGYLDRLFFQPLPGGDDAFIGLLAAEVLAIPDLGTLLQSYDGFIADEALAVPDATLLGGLAFADELHSCGRRDAEGVLHFDQQGNCTWGRVYGRGLDTDPSGAGPGYREDVLGLSLGVQSEIGAGTFLGLAASYESGDVDPDGGSGTVSRAMAGAIVKAELGTLFLSGSLSGGTFSSTMNRTFQAGGRSVTASGAPDGSFVAAHLRANSRIDRGDWFLDPTLDIGLTSMRQNAFVETGAGGFDMSVSALEQTTFSINPFVTFGTRFDQDGMEGMMSFRAGVLGLSGADPSVEAAFVGVGDGGPTFLIRDDSSDLFADLGAAIDLSVSDRLSIRGEVDLLVSDDQTSYGARLRLNYAF